MLVEHTFVTTMDAAEALAAVSDLLRARGFAPDDPPGRAAAGAGPVPPSASPNMLELRRGKKNPARAKSALELPQHVRVEWDRGRVVVAASTLPRTWAGRQYPPGGWRTVPASKVQPDQAAMLTAVAEAIELRLAYREPPERCLVRLDQVEAEVRVTSAARRRKNQIVGWSVVVLLFSAVGVIIYLNA